MTRKPFVNSWITDRIKAGRCPITADDVECLVADGITHVLDLRHPIEWLAPGTGQEALNAIDARGLKRLNLATEDCSAPTLETLDAAVAFIDQLLEDPAARVYVHCRAGYERTATVLVAWHARRHGVDYRTALEAMQAKRPELEPLRTQEEVTREWIRREVAGG